MKGLLIRFSSLTRRVDRGRDFGFGIAIGTARRRAILILVLTLVLIGTGNGSRPSADKSSNRAVIAGFSLRRSARVRSANISLSVSEMLTCASRDSWAALYGAGSRSFDVFWGEVLRLVFITRGKMAYGREDVNNYFLG